MASNQSAFMKYSNRDDESIAQITGMRHGSAFDRQLALCGH
jgi:predicted mannosyl-3-phosphoglycerate phosphatase (HAD superfamily)